MCCAPSPLKQHIRYLDLPLAFSRSFFSATEAFFARRISITATEAVDKLSNANQEEKAKKAANPGRRLFARGRGSAAYSRARNPDKTDSYARYYLCSIGFAALFVFQFTF